MILGKTGKILSENKPENCRTKDAANEKSSNPQALLVSNGRTNKGTRSRRFSAIVKSSGMFHIFSVGQTSMIGCQE